MRVLRRSSWRPKALALVLVTATSVLAEAADKVGPSTCNPYYPLITGTRWTYREQAPGMSQAMERTLTVLSTAPTAGGVTADLMQAVKLPGSASSVAGQARSTIRCDNGRVTIVIQGTAAADGKSKARGSVTARLPGLPPARDLVPGYEWRSQSEIESTEGSKRMLTRGVRENRVDSVEAVSVPAGNYPQAIKVLAVETLTTQANGRAQEARQEVIEWYAREVGLLKREIRIRRGQDVGLSTETLQSFFTP